MSLQELKRERWQNFFDDVSKSLLTQQVKVEVTGPQLGDYVMANWIALNGLTYDPKEDALTVFAEGLEHRVRHPQHIHIDQDVSSLHSLEAIDPEGNHHIVQLSAPLVLPSH
ncbi:MAG TPA: DUF5335 family protein [Burkholderiaceae bacterium]|nr:DUF5335 family protein [Burkholderiaceae bacterium]